MLEVITLFLLVVFLIWFTVESFRSWLSRSKDARPRPFWEAPPFPLENADRIYNWEQRVEIMSNGLLYPPHLSDRAVQEMFNKRGVKHGFF